MKRISPLVFPVSSFLNKSQQSFVRFSHPLKDFNQIPLDSRWSSGVYLVQVYENGCVLASGMVITQ